MNAWAIPLVGLGAFAVLAGAVAVWDDWRHRHCRCRPFDWWYQCPELRQPSHVRLVSKGGEARSRIR